VKHPGGRARRPLARLSAGRPGRAALILLAVYLPAALLGWAGWLLGLAPVFADARPLAIGLVGAIGLATVGTLVLVFGSWPMPTGAGLRLSRGYGERYDTFGAGAGFRLGLLRTGLQLVVTGSCLAALLLTVLDVRWFNLVPTEEMRSLPERAAAMPVPADWRLVRSDRGVDEDVKVPNAHLVRTYDVPAPVVVRDWLSAPAWAERADGRPFGALRIERCASATSCSAHLAPPAGRDPEFFVSAHLDGADSGHPQVQVRISYRQHAEPDLGASEVIVERAALMPVPDDWVRIEASGDGPSGATHEQYVQTFGVPDSFTPADLEAWLGSAAWTAPASGPAFGAIAADEPCRRQAYGTAYVCERVVSATVGTAEVESLTVWLETDHTVRITFERDW
jgi:hypothetical protein